MREFVLKGVADLRALLSVHKRMPDRRLGEVLLDEELITHDQLEQALQVQSRFLTGRRHLGQVLVEAGRVTAEQLNIALARKLAIPYVKLENYEVPPNLLTAIPPEVAVQYRVLPLAEIDGALVVAMMNPLDHTAVEALRFGSKRKLEVVMASADDIGTALGKYYSRHEEFEALEDLEMDPIADPIPSNESIHLIEQEAQKKPIVRLLNAIVLQAVMRGASDINIRPERNKVSVYYRVDGHMLLVRTLSRSLLPALVSRVKITGRMDIAERRMPQDGHARVVRAGKQIDLRISVIPTIHGESVVIRVLDKDVGFRPLDHLGLNAGDLSILRRLISRPNGMFLVTGPTGSGKSTTLYAILNEVKRNNPHVLTVEDPVEYDMEGVEQVQICLAKGYTFAEALKHFLRHDPDVIMIGEIRDTETADIANKAALTGHLVFSTLHTNDAPSTMARLVDMGIEPYLLCSTLLGVMSQRLVRLNCPECSAEEIVEPHIRKVLGLRDQERFFRGGGCYKCHYTGYQGRVAVTELLPVTAEIQDLILKGRPAREIAMAAKANGMRTLQENALALARAGKTSMEEVYALSSE